MGIDELNPHQRRAARETAGQQVKFGYCPTCRRYRWMKLNIRQWVCNECGCPVEEV